MLTLFDRAYWWVGLRLLVLVGCLVVMCGAAGAKPLCAHGWHYKKVPAQDGQFYLGCSDGKTLAGFVQLRDAHARLIMSGQFDQGQMNGVWTTYDIKGHRLKRPVFDHGKLVAEDSMPDDEADDGGGGE